MYRLSARPLGDCPAAPLSGCDAAEKSILVIKDKSDDSKDKLEFKFVRGTSTTPREGSDFGDPQNTTVYSLCLYANSALLGQVKVEPDATNWQPLRGDKGFKYKAR